VQEQLIPPYGSTLVNLMADAPRIEDLRTRSVSWLSHDLTPRQICDLELLVTGAFSPLTGFMTRADYESVRDTMRLSDGTLWPLPVTLDVPQALADKLAPGTPLALRDPEGVMLAVLHVSDLYTPDRELEAERVFGTRSPEHPAVAALLNATGPVYVGGRVEAVQPVVHHDFAQWRMTPAEVREQFARRGWSKVVAFQTRNPMHRAHFELTRRAAEQTGAGLLVHPVVGMTKPGDVDHYTRVRSCAAILGRYAEGRAMMSLLPLAMRMGGPREALLHAIVRRNHGCTHLIVGRDHAGPGSDSTGKPFYGPLDAQEMVRKHEAELGVTMVPFNAMVYVPSLDRYVPSEEVPPGAATMDISGTQLRQKLNRGDEIPEWYTFPEVAAELRLTYPPRRKQGFCVFFTGLSGSGKSTIANVLLTRILEAGGRQVTLLDGDLVRKHLSSELGFSKEHRDINIRRIGFVASEVVRGGGIAVCAPIAPYDNIRKEVRSLVAKAGGGFALVFVDAPVEVCEQRDRKGLYAKARAGVLKQFTGVSDPYETPADAEIVVDTTRTQPAQAVDAIVAHLAQQGYVEIVDGKLKV